MPTTIRPGDTLADRYRLDDLLSESGSGRFWRAHDRVLQRHVALHIMAADDERADALLEAARRSATVINPRILRVLDAQLRDDVCFVVNEWGDGTSLDIALANNGPLTPRRAAWVVAEVADSVAAAHARGVPHGRLVPENVLIDPTGNVRIIGLAVDAALNGLGAGDEADDVRDLAGLLYAALTGRWGGVSSSAVPTAPHDGGRVLRPRQVRAGVPRPLDDLVDAVLGPDTGRDLDSATAVAAYLSDFVGDPSGIPESMAAANPCRAPDPVVLEQVPDFAVRTPPPLPETPAETPPVTAGPVVAPLADVVPMPRSREEARRATLAARDDPDPIASRIDYFTSRYAPGTGADGAGEPSEVWEDEDWTHDDVWPAEVLAEEPEVADVVAPPTPRPLFADGDAQAPSDTGDTGAVDRRSRVEPAAHDDRPWDRDPEGRTPAVPAASLEEAPAGAVPGRRWLRLAGLVAVIAVLVLVAAAVLTRGSDDDQAGATDQGVTTAAGTDAVVTGLRAQVFDPSGTTGSAADGVDAAVDGDPSTSWSTGTFTQPFGSSGARTGLGLLVDTGAGRPISQVVLTLDGSPTYVAVYVLDQAPESLDTLQSAADFEASDTESIGLRPGTTGRYVLIWMTSLPQVGSGYAGGIAELAVRS